MRRIGDPVGGFQLQTSLTASVQVARPANLATLSVAWLDIDIDGAQHGKLVGQGPLALQARFFSHVVHDGIDGILVGAGWVAVFASRRVTLTTPGTTPSRRSPPLAAASPRGTVSLFAATRHACAQ